MTKEQAEQLLEELNLERENVIQKMQPLNNNIFRDELTKKMIKLKKKIEKINQNIDAYSPEYLEEIASQRRELLNKFYKLNYGMNVISFN